MLIPLIKVGARVRIKPGTRFYGGPKTSANPTDVGGAIIDGTSAWLSVKWDNKTKNNYEEHDLIFDEPNDMVEVDANKIYFKNKDVEIKDMNELLLQLYPLKRGGYAVATYYQIRSTDELICQCKKDKMRSFDDILILANTYLPGIEVKDVLIGLLMFNVKLEEVVGGNVKKSFGNCSTMKRIRYTNSYVNFKTIFYNIDCNKYDSIYSWRDLFNMIDVKKGEDLQQWYLTQFAEKEKPVLTDKE